MDDDAVNWDEYLQIASRSDVGMRRNNNQDNLCISLSTSLEQYKKFGHLFVVCDGMGGHAAGELASQLAADHLSHLHKRPAEESTDEQLRKNIERANAEIHRRGIANPEFRNMGTTCTCLLMTTAGAWAGHVGDSRLYRLRGSRLEQLTFDHSYTWEMKAAGINDASAEVFKNRIMRSLGPNPEVKVDIEGPFAIEAGDVFLLCSDGLTGPVTDRELAQILAALPPAEAAESLVNLANLRGGPDNITVIVAKYLRTIETGTSSLSGGRHSSSGLGMLTAWSILGLFVILAVVLGLFSDWTAAVAPGIAALVSLIVAIWLTIRHSSRSEVSVGPQRGKAPYTLSSGVASIEVVDKLRDMVVELVELAKREVWVLDWPSIDAQIVEVKDLDAKKQFQPAIAGYCRLINHLLRRGKSR
ncbi:MAG: protein phosphatase 2C domain-containing protein [Planctomycetaceae bacterium]|nr:protein phosphatase 2C domain-containing protein [Planctomycetaceae bacterium]